MNELKQAGIYIKSIKIWAKYMKIKPGIYLKKDYD